MKFSGILVKGQIIFNQQMMWLTVLPIKMDKTMKAAEGGFQK